MGEEVDVAGAEDKAAAELKGVLAQAALPVTAGRGTLMRSAVVAPQQVEHGSLLEADGTIGQPSVVDQKGKADASVVLERRGLQLVAEADRGEPGPGLADLVFVVAQLRDVLAAEDSAVMAQEYQHGRALLP